MLRGFIRLLPWVRPRRQFTGGFSGFIHFLHALTTVRIERGVAYFPDDGVRVSWLARIYRLYDGDIGKTQEYLRNEQFGEFPRSRILVAVWVTESVLSQATQPSFRQAA